MEGRLKACPRFPTNAGSGAPATLRLPSTREASAGLRATDRRHARGNESHHLRSRPGTRGETARRAREFVLRRRRRQPSDRAVPFVATFPSGLHQCKDHKSHRGAYPECHQDPDAVHDSLRDPNSLQQVPGSRMPGPEREVNQQNREKRRRARPTLCRRQAHAAFPGFTHHGQRARGRLARGPPRAPGRKSFFERVRSTRRVITTATVEYGDVIARRGLFALCACRSMGVGLGNYITIDDFASRRFIGLRSVA